MKYSVRLSRRKVSGLDGVDAWATLTTGTPSKREKILHNIDVRDNASALTIGDWKIIKGENFNC